MPPVSRILSLGGGGYTALITISSATAGVNVYSLAVSAGWNAIIPVRAIVNINDNVYSTTTATAAFIASGLPTGSKVFINIAAGKYIAGAGGLGGGIWSGPTNGSPGGTALYTRNTTFITNLGTIGGGGGGGGAGSSNYYNDGGYNNAYNGGGGGGGGAGLGTGGTGTVYAGWAAGNYGATGTINAGGAGGLASVQDIVAYDEETGLTTVIDQIYSGVGGAGGALGAAGTTPSNSGSYSIFYNAAAGGAAGSAIDGSSYVTLQTAGTISGAQIN
jgi:hypothetical protein